MNLRDTWMTVMILAMPGAASAQPKAATEFECRFTEAPIEIDGKLDEPAWKTAQRIDHFYQPWLGAKSRTARTATRARLLWDREWLYFAAEMDDADLYADLKKNNEMLWNNDVFELFFKPADDKPGYYEFQVNPTGATLSMFLPRRGSGGYQRYIAESDFRIQAKVSLRGTLNNWRDRDQGWTVEGKIAWTDFLRTGGRPAPNEKWKFALCRYDYSVDFEGPELSTCAPLAKPGGAADFHYHEGYATLTFLEPKGSGPGAIQKRIPMTTSKVIGSPDPPPPFQIARAFPKLSVSHPIGIHAIPGSDQLLVIATSGDSGPTKLFYLKDDPNSDTLIEALKPADQTYGIAFHPKWKENGYIYLGGNGPHAGPKDEKKTRVTRYTMQTKAPYAIDPNSAVEIIAWLSNGHNGGAVVFGHDGMLYITSGDGTSDSDTWESGQDMTRLLAKVLRIDVDHPEPGKQYAVPKDNPFVALKDARPETWALGLRNPWKMTIDRKTGHIWVGSNGQDLYEHAFLVQRGDNYGWSVTEGSYPFYPNRPVAPAKIVKPTVEHPHSEARSLTGGMVYYGAKYPELHGHYLYGDYSTGYIWAVKHDGQKIVSHKRIADTRLAVTAIDADTKGEILIADYQGKDKGALYTLVPTPREDRPNTFPRTLSASGLFKSVKGHVMEDSLIPYSVNAVLWSDGAQKERWLGIPGSHKLRITANRGWNLPDETVIVKSFWIETERGNPATRRWIETRFLTRQKGEWFGYSYAWNDEETEGTLVESEGRDREYHIMVNGRAEKFVWRYPSRTECMVCHSRAANWVLGLSEAQFNHEHVYGKSKENQLALLERLGFFEDSDWAAEAKRKLRDTLEKEGRTPRQINDYIAKSAQAPGQRQPVRSYMLPKWPHEYKRLADPHDKTADLEQRARAYLHSNCAQCHVEAGGGNAAMELAFHTPLDKMRIIDVKPLHDTFGIKDARIIAPGDPDRSVLLKRVSHRGKGHMPPLATRLVDEAAVAMLREWILQMKPTPRDESRTKGD
jgi:uncharacterized repeat protein (TIGR03806 family)